MEIQELYNPTMAAYVGPYCFTQGVEIEMFSSKTSYFDWSKIRFTGEYQLEISLAKKDDALIALGYDGVMDEIFTGYVSQPYGAGGFANEIVLKDEMLLLEETEINSTFLDTTPQEMISYFLAQAGIEEAKLSSQTYPMRKQVPIRKMNVIQAINAIHSAWGIKQPFYFSGGVFYWGEQPEQKEVYSFEYGVNILNLTRPGGTWELETVAAPFVKHSHKINVIHPQISGEVEVVKVVSTTNEEGFIRTRIYF
ncbi:hypothetical protein SDC9_75473 [bioreactor metagenome]|uniref:Serine/arginine repetitive matrix protein 2 n=1 Tax=bioreactor metagenome TaxID=1076179 RepID=A0A644YK30_9ZZZZ